MTRTRPPDTRGPLPSTVSRPAKLTRDRTNRLPPPAHIRVLGGRLADEDRDDISRKLGRKLGKYASSIERVTVRLSDANGPKGGRDRVCQIKVVISGLPSVVVEERDVTFQRAVDRALKAITAAVKRSVQRRRMKPLRDRSRTRARPAAGAISQRS